MSREDCSFTPVCLDAQPSREASVDPSGVNRTVRQPAVLRQLLVLDEKNRTEIGEV